MDFKKNLQKLVLSCIVGIFLLGISSAVHYIDGYVNDSYSGRSPDNELAFLWNHSNGKGNNLTDIIGVNGNSGSPNTYEIDCDNLQGGCNQGDILSLQVIDNNSYIEQGKYIPFSEIINVTVSSGDSTFAEDIQMNSPPEILNLNPEDNSYSNENIFLNCTYRDLDQEEINISLYANFSGDFQEINSTTYSGSNSGSLFYSGTESAGFYGVYCFAEDNLENTTSSQNTIIIDTTNPSITYFEINNTLFCGNGSLRLNCSVSETNLNRVYFNIQTPSGKINKSSSFNEGYYYSDFEVNETGEYSSMCIAEDLADNKGNSDKENFTSLEEKPDLVAGDINFSSESPVENQEMNVSIFVNNTGCIASGIFDIGFYKGLMDPENLISTRSLSLGAFTGAYSTFNFSSLIGKTNYSFFADYDSSIAETNKDNNKNSSILEIESWQTFRGQIEAIVRLADTNYTLTDWGNSSNFDGNVFITDYESNIDWSGLYGIEQTNTSEASSSDYSEIDSVLGMSDYSDSVSSVYSSPTYLDYNVSGRGITSVPSIASESGDPFYTGILWDGSDDTGNREYDSTDKEDLVFVTKVQKDVSCNSGVCDYEIKIPAKLRDADTSEDSQKVYLYHELE